MTLFEILSSFGARGAGFIPLSDAVFISERDYGFLPDYSVVSFYLPYYVSVKSNLANFAAARDYHSYFKEIFAVAEEYVQNKYPGAFFRAFADVSPFDEVKLAAMCSLGIVGDHGMLITPDASSFVVLGELVLSLSPDILLSEGIRRGEGKIGYCSRCGACRRGCPVSAIGKDKNGVCISSLTQKKGDLTEDEMEIVRRSGSVWGCDVCQSVCPYTVRAQKNKTLESDIPFFTEGRLGFVDEDTVAGMSDEEYGLYSFSWRKREVILRNIKIVSEGKKEDKKIK